MRTSRSFRKLRTLILLLCWMRVVKPAPGQETSSADRQPAVVREDAQESAQQPPASPLGELTPTRKSETEEKKKKAKKKSDHAGSFVVAPQPLVSPALGAGLIPIAGYITPIPARDRAITPSVIGAAGLITNDGSRAFGLGADLYLNQARYEWETGYGHGNLDYNLYGVGFENGNAGFKLPLEQSGQILFIKFLRKIHWDTFAGVRFINGSSFITLKPTSEQRVPIPPDVGLHTDLRALGMEVSRDSRPNRFYPLKGSVIDFTGDFFAHNLGSKYSFQSYKFTFNKYVSLSKKQVLAYNMFWCGTGGEPPFYGNCIYGSNNELRGYTAGRYLDRFMVATQLEYRLELPWRFGLVGFGGIGAVAPGGTQWRSDQLLPAGGTGIRYVLSDKFHVNLRTDFAWGKDNFTWSVGVGEAF